jgi:hypothetical protein
MADTYRIVTFPRSRLSTIDVGRYGRDAHSMYGLLEVDVTAARRAALQLYYLLPQWLRLLTLKALFADPVRARQRRGTVMVTTVGSSGRTAGWILPTRTMHNLQISIGSIARKPGLEGGRVAVRDIMHLTVGFNHDVVDGVPARRFMEDLVRHIEKGSLD